MRKPCPQYHIELDRVMQNEEVQEKLKENEDLFKQLEILTGKSVNNFDDVQDIYSTLKAQVINCQNIETSVMNHIFRKGGI